jgi:hypothetical protein
MVIFHIGRHKTGTSSIQAFLNVNRAALLSKRDIYYPEPIENDIAHHGLALALKRDDSETYRPLLREWTQRYHQILLSSEGFQFLRVQPVRLFIQGLQRDAKGIIYIREQFANAWSAYAQKVWGGFEVRQFEEVLQVYAPNYEGCLARWTQITRGNLIARVFDSAKLVEHDVVADFHAQVIGGDFKEFRKVEAVNPTLGWRVVNFTRDVNRRIVGRHDTDTLKIDLRGGMRDVAGAYPELLEKPIFPPALIERYQAKFVEQNKRIAGQYLKTTEPLFDLTWKGNSDYRADEGLRREHLEALYSVRPGLLAVSDIIDNATNR